MAPSDTGGVMPPPLGQKVNFSHPPSQTKNTIAIHSVCLTVVTLCIGMRFYTRYFISHLLGWDDLCLMFAYVHEQALTITYSALLIWCDSLGLGRHLWDITPAQLFNILRAFSIARYVYLILLACIKLSFLFFYRRIFSPSRWTRFFINVGIIFVAVAYTAVFFASLFEYVPVQKAWQPSRPGRCDPQKVIPFLSGANNVATDFYVLAVPIPCIYGLNMKWTRKIKTLAIFSLGIFVCATSIIRLSMTSVYWTTLDRTWNMAQIQIWGVLEVNVGLICSCLLALPAFLDRFESHRLGSFLSRWRSSISSRFERKPTSWTQELRSRKASQGGDGFARLKDSRSRSLNGRSVTSPGRRPHQQHSEAFLLSESSVARNAEAVPDFI